MKKLVLTALILGFLFTGIAFAEDSTSTTDSSSNTLSTTLFSVFKSAITNTSTGVFYSLNEHSLSQVTTGTVMSYESVVGTFSLDAMYGSSDLVCGGLMYKTETIEKLGITVPILKELFAKVGYGVGYDNAFDSDRVYTHGPTATLGANIKF